MHRHCSEKQLNLSVLKFAILSKFYLRNNIHHLISPLLCDNSVAVSTLDGSLTEPALTVD